MEFPQTPWYKENPFWGAIGGVFTFVLTGLGFGVNGYPSLGRWLLLAAFPWAAMALWISVTGLTKRRETRWASL